MRDLFHPSGWAETTADLVSKVLLSRQSVLDCAEISVGMRGYQSRMSSCMKGEQSFASRLQRVVERHPISWGCWRSAEVNE